MNFVGQVINILWYLEGSSEDLTKYQPSSYPYELLNIAVTFFVIMYSVRLRKSSFQNFDHNRVFMSVEPWTHALTSVTSHLLPLGAIALLKIHIRLYSIFVFVIEKQKKKLTRNLFENIHVIFQILCYHCIKLNFTWNHILVIDLYTCTKKTL